MNETFEDLFERYREISDILEQENLELDKALKLYDESNEIYNKLNKYIEDAKIKVNTIRD